MKKLLLSLLCLLTLATTAWAETLELSAEILGLTGSYGAVSYTDSESGFAFGGRACKNGGIALQANGGNIVITSNEYGSQISKLIVKVKTSSSKTTTLSVYGNTGAYTSDGTNQKTLAGTKIEDLKVTTTETEYSVDINSNFFGFTNSTSGGMITFTSLVIEYVGSSKETYDPQLPATYTLDLEDDYTFTLPEPKPENITWSTSDAEIVEVDGGYILACGAGTATITASWEEDETFRAGSAEVAVKVIDPNAPVPTDVTFDFTADNAYGMEIKSGSSYETDVTSITEEGVTLSFTGNYRRFNSTATGHEGPELRLQKNATMTVSAPEGYYISAVTFIKGTSGTDWYITASDGLTCEKVGDDYVCENSDINITEIKFTNGSGGATAFNGLKVEFVAAEEFVPAATPIITGHEAGISMGTEVSFTPVHKSHTLKWTRYVEVDVEAAAMRAPAEATWETLAQGQALTHTIDSEEPYTLEVVAIDAKGNESEPAILRYAGDLSGIGSVAADEAQAEYFDLRGVRMQGQLPAGVYIRRQGAEATKVIVK